MCVVFQRRYVCMNSNDFVIIGQDPFTKDFWYHHRANNDGKPGKVDLMGDGSGDVRPMINNYVNKGYAPERIIYNGQPVTDVFTKTTDEKGNITFKGADKGILKKTGNPQVRQVITTSSGEKVIVPAMLGSETTVVPLNDGTYKVITQAVVYPKPEPKVTIMTEDELVEHFAKFNNGTTQKLDIKA